LPATPAADSGRGSLSVVGTGIRFGIQTTDEARDRIERAGKVLYMFADQAPISWIERLNPSAESLYRFYAAGKPRRETYHEMVEEILTWVRKGLDVCVALYGHPGVFVTPSHEAVRRAREEGFKAVMLPGISAEDCLYADLGVDPGEGCQSYEATEFLLFKRSFDTGAALILWQVDGVGERGGAVAPNLRGLQVLAERLEERYGPDHKVVLYEASPYPVGDPSIERVSLRDLPSAVPTPMATLYVPPSTRPRPDLEMFDKLEISRPAVES
jgi:uncharacterized protein YabN with tetrapyrrole methylase and pyrophosphatase domain